VCAPQASDMAALGYKRRFWRCPHHVRSTSESGKMAAWQRTDVEGHKETFLNASSPPDRARNVSWTAAPHTRPQMLPVREFVPRRSSKRLPIPGWLPRAQCRIWVKFVRVLHRAGRHTEDLPCC
jgi:hypothetical protein